MKKALVSMIVGVAMIAGGNAYAQSKAVTVAGATQQKEKCDNCKGDNKDCKKGEKPVKEKKMKGNRPQFNPFDGVQLTPDQQQRLQVLQQGLGPVMLDKEQQSKIPENKNLTPEQKQQLKQEKEAKRQQAKKNYLNGVKETLTPDQYIIFLENCYLYSPQGQGIPSPKGFKASHHGEKGKKDHKDKRDKK